MANNPKWHIRDVRMHNERNEEDEGEVRYYSANQNENFQGVRSLGNQNGIVNSYIAKVHYKKPNIKMPNMKIPLLFQFTRHATSCFNIDSYPNGDGIFHLPLSDGIPSLANTGIAETIGLADKNKNTPRFHSAIVCVSNLIRTWMTAVLLYTFSNKKTITLRICPHLRETGGKGNGAYALTSSIPKFITFLELIKTMPSYSGLREIILLIPNTNNPNVWVEITIYIPEDKTKPVQNDPLFCMIDDPLLGKGYTEEGNIFKFLKWFTESFPGEEGIIHTVAHSHIMQKYVEKVCEGKKYQGVLFNMKEYSLRLEGNTMNRVPIVNQNCWSFTTHYEQTDSKQLLESIQPGYFNPGKGPALKDSQRAEHVEGVTSLCLKNVEPIVCPKKGGKRRTKKNRKSRRTRRRS